MITGGMVFLLIRQEVHSTLFFTRLDQLIVQKYKQRKTTNTNYHILLYTVVYLTPLIGRLHVIQHSSLRGIEGVHQAHH